MPVSAEGGQRHTEYPGNSPVGWPLFHKTKKSAFLSALLVAAPFGRASAVLRGTVWSGSAARGESLNSNNVPFLVFVFYIVLP